MRYDSLLKILKWIWIFAVVLASIYFLVNRFELVVFYFHSVPIYNLFIAVVFLILGKLALVFISKFSVESEGKLLSYFDTFCIVTFTQLAKYIPGGIWHFVGRYGAYNSQNMTFKKSTRALISENVWLLSGAFFTGSLFGILSPQGRELLFRSGIQIATLPLGVVLILLWFATMIGFKKLFLPDSSVSFIKILGAQLISWLCLGISFVFVMPNLDLTIVLFDISAYSFGWLIGYVAIFAPGGIGVRETALVWMLSEVMNSESAIIVSTVHRFLFIVVELLLGAIAGILQFSNTRKLQRLTIEAEKNN